MPQYMSFSIGTPTFITNVDKKITNFSTNPKQKNFAITEYLREKDMSDKELVKEKIGNLVTYINDSDEPTILANLCKLKDLIKEEVGDKIKQNFGRVFGNLINHYGLYPYLNNFSVIEEIQKCSDDVIAEIPKAGFVTPKMIQDKIPQEINEKISELCNEVWDCIVSKYVAPEKRNALLTSSDIIREHKPINVGKIEFALATVNSKEEALELIKTIIPTLTKDDNLFIKKNTILGDKKLTNLICNANYEEASEKIHEKELTQNFSRIGDIQINTFVNQLFSNDTLAYDFQKNGYWLYVFKKYINNEVVFVVRKFPIEIPFMFSGMNKASVVEILKNKVYIYLSEKFDYMYEADRQLKEILEFDLNK